MRLSRPRREKARASTVLPVSAPPAFSLGSVAPAAGTIREQRLTHSIGALYIGFLPREFQLLEALRRL